MDQWTLSWEFSHFQFVPTPKKSSIYIKIVIFFNFLYRRYSCSLDTLQSIHTCMNSFWIILFDNCRIPYLVPAPLRYALLNKFFIMNIFFVNHSRHNFLKNEREFIINISGFCWTITSRMFYNLHFISLWCPTFQHDSFSPRYFFIWKIFFTIF